MKKTIIILFAVLAALMLSSCILLVPTTDDYYYEPAPIKVNPWDGQSYYYQYKTTANGSWYTRTYTFYLDGSYTKTTGYLDAYGRNNINDTQKGTYTYTADRLTLKPAGFSSSTYTYRFNSDYSKMWIGSALQEDEYTRQ